MANFSSTPVFFTGPNGSGTPVFVRSIDYADECVMESGIDGAIEYLFETSVDHAAKTVFLTGCFPKSEVVYTNSHKGIPIGSIKAGDRICSWDVVHKKAQYTEVSEIHQYRVREIICFNNTMRVSSSHPLMVIEGTANFLRIPKWKVAFDVNIGDCIVGTDGKYIIIRSKSRYWYDKGIDVLNISTDNGVPFIAGGCVVRANNAKDDIEWANTPITKKLVA